MASSRPGGVTVVSILAWISGLLQVITATIVLLAGGSTSSLLTTLSWILGILGIVTIIVAIGLWRGNRAARIIATIVFVLNLANAVLGAFSATGSHVWSLVTSALLALIGLIFLWTRAASDYFRA